MTFWSGLYNFLVFRLRRFSPIFNTDFSSTFQYPLAQLVPMKMNVGACECAQTQKRVSDTNRFIEQYHDVLVSRNELGRKWLDKYMRETCFGGTETCATSNSGRTTPTSNVGQAAPAPTAAPGDLDKGNFSQPWYVLVEEWLT